MKKINTESINDYPGPYVKHSEIPTPESDSYLQPEAFLYPGARPNGSFLINGENVITINPSEQESSQPISPLKIGESFMVTDENGNQISLDDFLETKGALKIEDRIPVIAFGSNANPSQLKDKFAKLDDPTDRDIVPNIATTVVGFAPAYLPRTSLKGYIPADLIAVDDVVTSVVINFLTPAQLEKMHQSEGPSYSFCKISTAGNDTVGAFPAYVYLGNEGALTDKHGKPILLGGMVDSHGQFPEMNQQQILTMLASDLGDQLSAPNPIHPNWETFKGTATPTNIKVAEFHDRQNNPAIEFPYDFSQAPNIVMNMIYNSLLKKAIDNPNPNVESEKIKKVVQGVITNRLTQLGRITRKYRAIDSLKPSDVQSGAIETRTGKSLKDLLTATA